MIQRTPSGRVTPAAGHSVRPTSSWLRFPCLGGVSKEQQTQGQRNLGGGAPAQRRWAFSALCGKSLLFHSFAPIALYEEDTGLCLLITVRAPTPKSLNLDNTYPNERSKIREFSRETIHKPVAMPTRRTKPRPLRTQYTKPCTLVSLLLQVAPARARLSHKRVAVATTPKNQTAKASPRKKTGL